MRAVALATVSLLVCSAVGAAEKKPLSADEMKALLASGTSIDIMDPKGGKEFKGHVDIKADGTQSGSVTMTGKPPIALSGTWKLKGNKFCRVLLPVEKKEVCETWVRTGDNQVTVMVGKKVVGINMLP